MEMLDDLLKTLQSNPGSLVGKDVKIDDQTYHIGGANSRTGLSGSWMRDHNNPLNQHLSIDDLRKRNK